ncbi:MAG TPA: hypothetical protein VKV95_04090 [Terriglobia bacterium]|nr:hypothetical protein [Terriglobia bacterium]
MLPTIRRRTAVALTCLLMILVSGIRPALSQETVEQRFQRAKGLYNSAHADEACELFKQIQKDKPDFPQLKEEMANACGDAEMVRSSEDRLYIEGQQFVQQGKCDEAKAKFENALQRPLVHPKHKSEIVDILNSWKSDEAKYQNAINLSKQGKIDAARTIFNQLASGGCPRGPDAKNELTTLAKAAAVAPPKPSIKTAPPPINNQAPVNNQPDSGSMATDQMLRDGLQEYFEGKYDDAERNLSKYLQNNGKKQGLAYFFRGASHSTRYFISGEKEVPEKQMAIEDFRALKEHNAQFRLPEKYVSQKILALYAQAIKP